MKRSRRKQGLIVDAVARNIYTSPALDYLQRGAPDVGFLFGEFKITDVEIQSSVGNEGAFIGLFTARIESTLDEMVAYLRAPTFPVHDDPAPRR